MRSGVLQTMTPTANLQTDLDTVEAALQKHRAKLRETKSAIQGSLGAETSLTSPGHKPSGLDNPKKAGAISRLQEIDRLEVCSDSATRLLSTASTLVGGSQYAADVEDIGMSPQHRISVENWIDRGSQPYLSTRAGDKGGATAANAFCFFLKCIGALLWIGVFVLFVVAAIMYTLFWGILQVITGFTRCGRDSVRWRKDLGGGLDWTLELWRTIW
jgi:hypothetical protein